MNIPMEIIILSLTSLIGALGYVSNKVLNAFSKNTDAFNSINESIQDIRLWITQKDTSDKYEEKECKFIHENVSKRFDNHEKRITKLEGEK